VIAVDPCIQCGAEPRHGSITFTRPRPMGMGDYSICLDCARRVRKEQDERAQEAIAVAERAGI
jgi:hypothetical protein